jgi:hypothetical protein
MPAQILGTKAGMQLVATSEIRAEGEAVMNS